MADRTEMIKGLRALADTLENTTDEKLPIPYAVALSVNVAVSEYGKDPETGEYGRIYDTPATLEKLRKAKSAFPGLKKKEMNDWAYSITKEFSSNVRFVVQATRESVCKRVVTETVHHPAKLVTAWDEEKYEWVCSDAILLSTDNGE